MIDPITGEDVVTEPTPHGPVPIGTQVVNKTVAAKVVSGGNVIIDGVQYAPVDVVAPEAENEQ